MIGKTKKESIIIFFAALVTSRALSDMMLQSAGFRVLPEPRDSLCDKSEYIL